MHAIIAVTVIASSGLSLVSSGLALQNAIMAKSAMNAGRTAVKSSGLLKESLNFPSNVLKGINSIEAGGASYVSDIMTSSDYTSQIQMVVKHIMTQNQDMATKLFDANMLNVLDETEGMIANLTIVDIVQSGLYANTTSLTPEFETQLRYLWTASAIGTMWSTENNYIVASDVSDGGCKADSRGHPSLKACLDEYPDKVFYTFFKTNARGGIYDRALMRGPPGHKRLKEATNFTITDVVRSSMTTFEQFRNKDSGSLMGATGFQTLFGNASAMGNGGGPARGLFNLPICYTPGGEAITSINTKEGLNYPCMCSMFNVKSQGQRSKSAGGEEQQESVDDEENQEQADDEEEESQNDILSKRESSSGTWTGDIDATHDFLVASRMYSSGDFRQFCQRNKNKFKFWEAHGNKCELDKSHTWSWPKDGDTGKEEPADEKDEGRDGGGKVRRDAETTGQAVASQNNQAGIIKVLKELFETLIGPIENVTQELLPGKKEDKDAAMHPFKGCVSNPHTVVGCEEPNNDGHHENTGCGGSGGNGRFR